MKKINRHPDVQRLICAIYIILEALLSAYVFISAPDDINLTLMFLSDLTIIISALTVTMLPDISDHVHAVSLVTSGQIATWIIAFCINDFRMVHYGVIITTIVVCLYEMVSAIKYQLLLTIGSYLAFIIVLTVFIHAPNDILRNFIWTSAFVVLSQMVLTYVVGHVERYKQVIRENSRSSQDMLKIVQMKRREAQEATKAKSQFLSNMSHEIRTPINAILGMDEIIIRESNESNVVDYASKIQNAGNTLLSLINDILDFSKIESGRVELYPEQYETHRLFSELYDMVVLRTEEKGLKLHFDIAYNLPRILYGDLLRVKQVLINVLNNAVKYTEKGSVTLSVEWVETSPMIAKLMISVRDTGIGIRKEDMERIFTSFERIDEAKNRHIEGSGLGMNITKNLVEMMRGSISVESELNKGSVFRVELPQDIIDATEFGAFYPKKKAATPKQFREQSFLAPKAQILVVDDNEMNIVVIKGLLKKYLAQCDSAVSGIECLAKVKQKHYDLIFMDHMMPEMDGVETFLKIKEMEGSLCRNTPVIVLTANAIVGARDQYLAYGFSAYLSKPVRGRQVEEVLQDYLPQDVIEYAEVNEPFNNSPKDYPIIPGLQYEIGLSYAGEDETQYRENLTVFINAYATKSVLLAKCLEKKEWERYVIEVHALKSNARYIGANELGEIAYAHEQAGKAEEYDYILEQAESLAAEWKKVVEAIDQYLGPRVEKVDSDKYIPITKDVYIRKLNKIILALQDYEIDEVVSRLRDLLSYDLNAVQRQSIQKAAEAADNFDYVSCRSILEETKKMDS